MANDRDSKFVDSLKIGDIVHYDWGFHSFVRCEVIELNGCKQLKPLAICGAWKAHELPHRSQTGRLVVSASDIIMNNDEMIMPYASMIFEAPGYAYREKNEVNPAKLKAIDLTVPSMTAEQERDAVFYRAIEVIRAIFDADPSRPHAPTPLAQLRQAQKIILQTIRLPRLRLRPKDK